MAANLQEHLERTRENIEPALEGFNILEEQVKEQADFHQCGCRHSGDRYSRRALLIDGDPNALML